MELKKHGVRSALIRLGEGLVIGIGVAIALSGYEAFSNATEELRKTRTVLEKQVEINQKLKDQIVLRDQRLARVKDQVVETELLADRIGSLAERLRAFERASGFDAEGPFNSSEFDWSRFQPADQASFTDSSKWEEISESQLESLQNSIDELRNIQRN